MKKRRKINPQKIFCFVSFIFILTCCFWYGGRFIYFYKDSKKTEKKEANIIATTLKTSNQKEKTFKKDNEEYYFYQDATNNYLMYSNILWRIIKINEDNSIVLITDTPITSLAYGTNEDNYSDSNIIKWLNTDSKNDNSGILESKLNNTSNYLVKTKVCIDTIDNIEKLTCNKTSDEYYLGLLSIEDYVKTGGKKSFIKNSSISYLSNKNKEKEIWYINEDGSLSSSSGDDILGIRPVVTLSPTLEIKSGTGTEKDPYKIEDKNEYFASYVKLDKDIWRVYDVDEQNVKLVLMDYIKDQNNEKLEYIYSNNTYIHNDTIYGSLAYYLNHTYLNSLSYKDLILNSNYNNGYYGEDSDYNLKELFSNKIDTKVGLPSIGEVTLNHELDNYFTSTGVSKNSSFVYINKNNGELTNKKVTSEANIVPCITIKKDNLTKGTGSINDPYRTE